MTPGTKTMPDAEQEGGTAPAGRAAVEGGPSAVDRGRSVMPSPADVSRWIAEHPQHADAVKELACSTLEAGLLGGTPHREHPDGPSAAEIERAVRSVMSGGTGPVEGTRVRRVGRGLMR